MANQDDNQVYVFPYGLYLGKDDTTGKTYVQTGDTEYVEVDPKWDGILKAVATVPSLTQFKETLVKAGVKNVDEYIDSLIAGEMLTLVDAGANVTNSVANLYEWVLVPSLKYEGKSNTPSLTNMSQVNVSANGSLPFSISYLTFTILADENQRILKAVLPAKVAELESKVNMTEKELYTVFVNDVRKLVQRKAAFFV